MGFSRGLLADHGIDRLALAEVLAESARHLGGSERARPPPQSTATKTAGVGGIVLAERIHERDQLVAVARKLCFANP